MKRWKSNDFVCRHLSWRSSQWRRRFRPILHLYISHISFFVWINWWWRFQSFLWRKAVTIMSWVYMHCSTNGDGAKHELLNCGSWPKLVLLRVRYWKTSIALCQQGRDGTLSILGPPGRKLSQASSPTSQMVDPRKKTSLSSAHRGFATMH